MICDAAKMLSIFNAFHILIKQFIVALVKSPPQDSAPSHNSVDVYDANDFIKPRHAI